MAAQQNLGGGGGGSDNTALTTWLSTAIRVPLFPAELRAANVWQSLRLDPMRHLRALEAASKELLDFDQVKLQPGEGKLKIKLINSARQKLSHGMIRNASFRGNRGKEANTSLTTISSLFCVAFCRWMV